MKPLHMVEIVLDMAALHRFLHVQGIAGHEDDAELGYGIHAWLGAAFGDRAPKPWRLLMDRRRPARILGYSEHSADELRQFMSAFADPMVVQVCSDPNANVVSKQIPSLRPGSTLGFEVLCCPVGRKSGSGVEKDVFLMAVDSAPEDRLSREAVYSAWLTRSLENKGVSVTNVELRSFRMVKQMRRTYPNEQGRRVKQLRRPHAVLGGLLTITDPEAFHNLLATGVGRHRAFGYGMLLMRPVR